MNDDFMKQFRRPPDSNFVEKIHIRLERKERMQAIKRYSVLSVFALIFAFGMLMTFSSTVRADLISIIEEIAGLRFDVTANYPGNPDEEVTIVPSVYLSLEEAQNRFPSPIMLPAYLLQGYERRAEVELLNLGNLPTLTITWDSKEMHAGNIRLNIKHCSSGFENCGQIVGEGSVEEIMLNEKPAVIVRGGWNYDTRQYDLYPYGQAIVELMWKYDDHTVYALGANEQKVSVEELIKIAESIP